MMESALFRSPQLACTSSLLNLSTSEPTLSLRYWQWAESPYFCQNGRQGTWVFEFFPFFPYFYCGWSIFKVYSTFMFLIFIRSVSFSCLLGSVNLGALEQNGFSFPLRDVKRCPVTQCYDGIYDILFSGFDFSTRVIIEKNKKIVRIGDETTSYWLFKQSEKTVEHDGPTGGVKNRSLGYPLVARLAIFWNPNSICTLWSLK